ncbi:MAG: CoB--CoM heterodisulfide reductase iron-sulfur subunit A family protein [Nitrospirota bacterium]
MSEKIGVFICECGPNIRDAIDINEIESFARSLKDVIFVRTFGLLCSDKGKEIIKEDIKKSNLTRVVFAGCSPKEHEITFRKVLKETGLNPFLLQVANIREQCAWVVKDRKSATQKAKAIINGAVRRVIFQEPLEIKEIECQPDVLVVGAGITGISAALTLAQKNRKVYLLEKLPSIGGRAALYEEIFPGLECASCMLAPKLDEVLHNDHIEVSTLSEVQEVRGYFGNFLVKVKKRPRFVDVRTCIGCGACFEVCPVKVKNEYNEGLDERRAIYIPYAGALPNVAAIDRDNCLHFLGKGCDACQKACPFGSINFDESDEIREIKVGATILATGFDIFDPRKALRYGYGKVENVYTALEFERMLNSTGPTGGKILLRNGHPPRRIALVHCVGSRSEKYKDYCSEICCMYLLKFARMAKKKLPDVSISEFYSDFCLPGKESQRFCDQMRKERGMRFIHIKKPVSIKIQRKKGNIVIHYTDINGKTRYATSDMVVLAPAITGVNGAEDIARIFDISQDKDGFFIEEHRNLAPVSTVTRGVYVAGCAQGPKDIQDSVAQGQAAAGIILSQLVPGENLMIETVTATVREGLCSGCKICVSLCPYKAITYDEEKKEYSVNEILCRGCGICASTCPAGVIKARHFTDKEILAEMEGLLE